MSEMAGQGLIFLKKLLPRGISCLSFSPAPCSVFLEYANSGHLGSKNHTHKNLALSGVWSG